MRFCQLYRNHTRCLFCSYLHSGILRNELVLVWQRFCFCFLFNFFRQVTAFRYQVIAYKMNFLVFWNAHS